MKKLAAAVVALSALAAVPSVGNAQVANMALVKACYAQANTLAGKTAVRGETAVNMAERCIKNGGTF